MRPHQVFAAMSPESATRFFGVLAEGAPLAFQQVLLAACAALKARPRYLLKQPPDRQAAAARRALSRVGAAEIAEQTLAAYFLECRKDLLIEWLDRAGVAHEDGGLMENTPEEPPGADLEVAVAAFRNEKGEDRELLLQAFAAQPSVRWPRLDALLEGQ